MTNYIQLDITVHNLQFQAPWSLLTDKEKNYAYFLQKACWEGSKIVFHQISYESPILFIIFQAYFQKKNFQKLQDDSQVTELEWKQFLAYVAAFYANYGNYRNAGHQKFIPEISLPILKKILQSNELFSQNNSNYKQLLHDLLPLIEKEIYAIESPYTSLNYPSKGGVTAYFSRNITQNDLDLIKEFLLSVKIDILNTRAFKFSDHIEISVGSIDENIHEYTYKDQKFIIKYGEFSNYLKNMNYYLQQAKQYAANTLQQEMIDLYIKHFQNGDINIHKDSQRAWIKDKSPVIECNLGWIETYIDPQNTRAYFEGWVACVDKDKSVKFQNLVRDSEKIILKLPWPRYMEKDNFLKPDFVTLDIINFSTNGCPLGINIPNYDDIRDNEGFKNVFLGNSIPNYQTNTIQFATPEQIQLLRENSQKCYVVHVACHELLGHGVGKLIYKNNDQQQEFLDPITNEKFISYYEQNETWNSKFGDISTSYEECRADVCGLYLCTYPEVYSLFGIEDNFVEKMLWVSTMGHIRKGILGLNMYNAQSKKWGQAHVQGAFVFSMFLFKNQKTDIVRFEIKDDEFLIHLNQDNLYKEGRILIKDLLLILQVYKSSGDVKRGQKFYKEYSEVSDYFLKVKEIVEKKIKQRRLDLNNGLIRYNEKCIEVSCYPENFEGIIMSFQDRFQFDENLVDQVKNEFQKYSNHLRV